VCAAGIDIVQGYFAGKPMAAEQIPAWLAKWAEENSV
jgi:EAL domain-containing protein (putative c-di-GMP-specific phosphodiesterase class I)